jgi:hypothetical protein
LLCSLHGTLPPDWLLSCPTPMQGRKKNRIARAASAWLDVRHFGSTAAAVQALRSEGWTLWATDLSPGSVSLVQPGLQVCGAGTSVQLCALQARRLPVAEQFTVLEGTQCGTHTHTRTIHAHAHAAAR